MSRKPKASTFVPTMSCPRSGADDANRIPSLQNGKPVAHKAPTAMTSSVQDFAFDKRITLKPTKKVTKKCNSA